MRIILVASFLTALTAVALPQQSLESLEKETRSKLLDEPAAAYKLTAKGRAVQFCNRTPKAVTGFRLGCAEKKDGGLHILSERDFEKRELPAEGEAFTCWSVVAFHAFPLEECSKGKVAAIEVALADGTVWKLKP
jgi:hypothetical protein